MTITNSGTQSNEQRYYDVLRKIAKAYMTTKQIRRDSEHPDSITDSYEDYLEMAYDNIQWDAAFAIKGKRRPQS